MVSPELLRQFPLFADQSFYMLEEIAILSKEVNVEKGDWLFREEEEASKFYLILDGKIELTIYLFLNGDGQHLKATSPFGRGEILGWSSIVKPYRYTLGARAKIKSRLLEIEAEQFRVLLDDNPEYGYSLMKKITEVISERLEFKYIQLLSLLLDSEGNPVKKTV